MVWYSALRRWILGGGFPKAPINVARKPWGPWTESFDICDATWEFRAGFLRSFAPDRNAGNDTIGGLWNETGKVYAPYLIRRWMRWDRSTRSATVFYTLSVYDEPNGQVMYQPQLMRSTITCP